MNRKSERRKSLLRIVYEQQEDKIWVLQLVTLKKGEGRLLKSGGMWIFDNEIDINYGQLCKWRYSAGS